jgi:disulfide bond formation protein DsbB
VLGSGAPPPEVQCDVVTWQLFGLSMATYNALCSFLIATLGALGLSKLANNSNTAMSHAA